MSLRRTLDRRVKRQCSNCGHTYSSHFTQHIFDSHYGFGGDLQEGNVPDRPFFGDHYQCSRDTHIFDVDKTPRKAYYLREKLAEMMREQRVIPRQYWLAAADAAYKHECIGGRLPKAKKQPS